MYKHRSASKQWKLTESESVLKMLHREPPLKFVIMNGKFLQSIIKWFISQRQPSTHLILIQMQFLQICKLVIFRWHCPRELILRCPEIFQELCTGRGMWEITLESVVGNF